MTSTVIEFIDLDSGDQGHLIVRDVSEGVGLTITLKQNGDLAAYFPHDVCERLISALQRTLAQGNEG